MSLWIKICGITSVDDARGAVDAGADALGLNLIASSKRVVSEDFLAAVRSAVGTRVELVAIVADLDVDDVLRLLRAGHVDRVQLHGSETPELLGELGERAYKAVRIGGEADVLAARRYPGDRLLVDAKVDGALGGSGQRFDWALAGELSRERRLVVAGGLSPDNVAQAVTALRPFGVDVASGVESPDPRRKDAEKMASFVRAARGALASHPDERG